MNDNLMESEIDRLSEAGNNRILTPGIGNKRKKLIINKINKVKLNKLQNMTLKNV